jgi:Lamin Tail Domain
VRAPSLTATPSSSRPIPERWSSHCPRISGRAPDLNGRGISVRLEAIDTLETHFNETHQELLGANAARDALLEHLGFTGVTFWPDLPNKVQAADQDRVHGHVLSTGIDANGRMIGFVYSGDSAGLDGSSVWVDETLVERSVNALLLRRRSGISGFLRDADGVAAMASRRLSRAARAAKLPIGLWPRSTADPDGPAAVVSIDSLEQLVVWPKLFRRIVPCLAGGAPDFDGFDAWLRADPVHRDDRLFLLGLQEDGNIHEVVRAAGDEIQLTAWPEDFIIAPDPPPPGVPTGRRPFQAGDVLVVAALPDPAGTDLARETVTVLNATDSVVDLAGWTLVDAADGRHNLSGTLAGGAVLQVQLNGGLRLGNKGDALLLEDGAGGPIDQVTYDGSRVQPGRTICFGR